MWLGSEYGESGGFGGGGESREMIVGGRGEREKDMLEVCCWVYEEGRMKGVYY